VSTSDRFSEKKFTCPICKKPVNLDTDETADENGQMMHEQCYLSRLVGHGNDPPDPHHAE